MSEFGGRGPGRAWAIGVVALALLAAVLVAPVRSAALGLLDVFRVEKFAAITVDVSKPPMNMEGGVALDHRRERAHKPNLNAFGTYSGPRKLPMPEKVGSLAAASEEVGYEVARAGESVAGRSLTAVYVSKPFEASYTFDAAKIRARLAARGLTGVNVPEQIDGKTFTLSAPAGVWARYGSGDDSVVFVQGPSPELKIPEGVNMDYLRQDFLSLPGLPPDLVSQVQAIEDWEHTLVVPLPPNGTSKEVRINGADGLLISDAAGERNTVLWQRDGRLYGLAGPLDAEALLTAAREVEYP